MAWVRLRGLGSPWLSQASLLLLPWLSIGLLSPCRWRWCCDTSLCSSGEHWLEFDHQDSWDEATLSGLEEHSRPAIDSIPWMASFVVGEVGRSLQRARKDTMTTSPQNDTHFSINGALMPPFPTSLNTFLTVWVVCVCAWVPGQTGPALWCALSLFPPPPGNSLNPHQKRMMVTMLYAMLVKQYVKMHQLSKHESELIFLLKK